MRGGAEAQTTDTGKQKVRAQSGRPCGHKTGSQVAKFELKSKCSPPKPGNNEAIQGMLTAELQCEELYSWREEGGTGTDPLGVFVRLLEHIQLKSSVQFILRNCLNSFKV